MSRKSNRIRSIPLTLSTLAVLVLIAVGYFFFYIQQRETAMDERNFRVLHKISENIIAQKETFVNNARHNAVMDSIRLDFMRKHWSTEPSLEAFYAFYRENINNLKYQFQETGSVGLIPDSTMLKDTLGEWHLVQTGQIKGNALDERGLKFCLAQPFDDFLRPVLRKEVFDEMVVFRKGDPGKPYRSIYFSNQWSIISQGLENGLDTLLKVQLKPKQRHELAGFPYRIYLQPLTFLPGEELLIGGLVDEERFDREKKSFPPIVMLFLSIAAVLILLAFPTLKLLLMSKHETLSVRDVAASFLTIILSASVIALLLVNGYQFSKKDNEAGENQLEALHQQITRTFLRELKEMYAQTDNYDLLRKNDTMVVPDVLSRDSTDPFHPKVYPFFTKVLWSTNYDSTCWEINTLEKPNPVVSIAGREYLKRVKREQTWKLPNTTGDGAFVLQSILSRTNGEQLALIAKESQADSGRIVLLTSNMYSVIRPILPQGFGFCIIDQNGLVLFHSDQSRNLQENFLEECANSNFYAAMFSRDAMHVRADYQGVVHEFYIRPLNGLPLSLITFENKGFYSVHAQTLSLNLFFALLFILSILLFLGALYLAHALHRNANNRSALLINWLRPDKKKASLYRFLMTVNLIVLIAAILTAWSVSPFTAMNILLLANFYVFVLAWDYLGNGRQIWKKNLGILLILGSVLFLFHFLMVYYALEYGEWESLVRIFLLELVPLLLIILRKYLPNAFFQKVSSFWTFIPSLRDSKKSYRFFMLSWLMLLSILPVIKVFQVSYNYERMLLTQRAHIQMARQVEERNRWNKQRFLHVRQRDILMDSLQRKSVYADSFYYQTRFDTLTDRGIVLKIDCDLTFEQWKTLNEKIRGNGKKVRSEIILKKADSIVLYLPLLKKEKEPHRLTAGSLRAPSAYAKVVGGDSLDLEPESFQMKVDTADTLITLKIRVMPDPDAYFSWIERLKAPAGFDSTFVDRQLNLDYESLLAARRGEEPISVLNSGITGTFAFAFPLIEKKAREKEKRSDILQFFAWRLPFNDIVRQTNRLVDQQSANDEWYWIYLDDRLRFYYRPGDFTLSSELPIFQLANPWNDYFHAILFWLVFAGFLLLCYKMIDFHLYRIYEQPGAGKDIRSLPAVRDQLLQIDTGLNILLVVPPYPLESDYMKVIGRKVKRLGAVDAEVEVVDIDRVTGLEDLDRNTCREALKISEDNPILVVRDVTMGAEAAVPAPDREAQIFKLLQLYPDKQFIWVTTQKALNNKFRKGEPAEKKKEQEAPVEMKKRQEWLGNFVEIHYPVERWEYLHKRVECLDFLGKGTAFLQTAPERIESLCCSRRQPAALFMEKRKEKYLLSCSREDYLSERVARVLIIDQNAAADELDALLDKLEAEKGQPLHLLSAINPSEILERYDRIIHGVGDKTRKGLIASREQWEKKLSSMSKGILLLNTSLSNPAEAAQSTILEECANGLYLQHLQQDLMTQFGEGTLAPEKVIREIESEAWPYYQSLWDACTGEEQLMLIDLADDGVMNGKDHSLMEELVRKGLIVFKQDYPCIMSESFRRFINQMAKEEQVDTSVSIIKEGEWEKIRRPISLTLIALAVFILFTQEAVMNNLLAVFTGIAALTPILRDLMSTVSMTEKFGGWWPFGRKAEGA